MASLLIKGMDMPNGCINPKNGNACPILLYCMCGCTHPLVGKRGADCPLVEIPTHGRLIDADELKARVMSQIQGSFQNGNKETLVFAQGLNMFLEYSPTVIEASEVE